MSNIKSISFIIPTVGRDTLGRTIQSIEAWLNDEIIVEVDRPPSRKWGNVQRNRGMIRATGDYLAFIDDDDYYLPGHREVMAQAIEENPNVPIIFRLQYPNGDTLWKYKTLIPGNVSTQMMLVPNKPEMLHTWEGGRNMADFIFMDKWNWPKEKIVWREEIIVTMGHDSITRN